MMMNTEEVIKEVNAIFIDVLDDEDIVLKPETTADDIEDWDSLNHIQLVVAVEKHFNIRFTSAQIQSFQNVGDMCQFISEIKS